MRKMSKNAWVFQMTVHGVEPDNDVIIQELINESGGLMIGKRKFSKGVSYLLVVDLLACCSFVYSLRKSRRKLLKPRRNSLIVSKRNWINCYPQQIRLGLKKPLSFVFAIFSIPLMEKQLAQLGEHSTSEGSWVRAPHCFF